MTTMELGTRNPAYASVEQASQVTAQLAKMGEAGWTRPDILAAFGKLDIVGVTDSVVYRAQRDKVHTVELPVFKRLFDAVDAGDVKPRVKTRKAKVADIADKAYAAAAKLAEFGDPGKAKVDNLRALIGTLAEILPEPKADEPEAPAEGDNDENGENGENPDA
jgi:hypothetical protein